MSLLNQFKDLFTRKQTDLHALIDEREEDASPITAHERELITNAFQFRTVEADEVSVPRSEITYLKLDDTFKHVFNIFQNSRYSRLPVVGTDLDDILGFITLKDAIAFVGREKEFTLASNLRPATFVPDNMPLPRVLQLMKKDHIQLVMIADEYGGTAGLLSLKDILEELVGEVEDEHEVQDAPLFRQLTPQTFWVDARLSIEDAIKQLSIQLPLAEGDNSNDLPYETIGGLVLHICGRVPNQNDVITIGHHKAKVITADGRRVTALELTI